MFNVPGQHKQKERDGNICTSYKRERVEDEASMLIAVVEHVGVDGGKYMDPVYKRSIVLLQRILISSQVLPILLPIHPQLRRFLQGRRSKHRRSLRSTLFPHLNLSVDRYCRWVIAVFHRLFHDMAFSNRKDVVTAVQNFPLSRGTAVGIMKGFLGLSGAILIKVYQTIYAGEPSHFILVLALLPSILPLVLMFLVNVYPDGGEDDARYLNGFSIISLLVAAYLMVLIIWENLVLIKTAVRVVTFGVLLLLLASPLWILFKAQGKESSTTVKPISHERIRLMDDTDLLESQEHDRRESREIDRPSDSQNKEDLNILQAMSTTNFWLLFISMACGMGSGLATVNNISQIGDSLGYTSVEISTLVSLWSIWNFLGRFGAGYTSDFFQTTRGFARPLFIAITIATMSVGLLVIASGFPGALYLGTVLVGVCYGCQWSLMPTITSELFGVMHMGTIFNTISIASPLGSYVLSVRLVGYVYDMEASSSGTKTCSGVNCFRLSFLIMASVNLLGFVTSLVLFFRTRKFYEQVVIKKFRHDSSVNHKDQSSFFEPE